MQNYELTVVLSGKATEAKKKSLKEKIENIVKNFDGKVTNSFDWGKKELAYDIAKSDTGIYLFFELKLETKSAKQILPKLNMEGDIVRYLLIKGEKTK